MEKYPSHNDINIFYFSMYSIDIFSEIRVLAREKLITHMGDRQFKTRTYKFQPSHKFNRI